MTHRAVLRHGFDIHRNPDRLGPLHDDAKFWLALGGVGESPSWLIGNVLWLISWEGFMKTHHVISGWFLVERVGKRSGVVAEHFASGNDGALFARGAGPLDMRPWFQKFVETHRRFREGEPTEIDEHVGELLALCQASDYRVPAGPARGDVTQGMASL